MVTAQNTQVFEELCCAGEWDYHVDINHIDSSRKTLLHYAVEQQNVCFIWRILKRPEFEPYIGEASCVLFSLFWLRSLSRRTPKSRKC
jgi:hypothetical protein